MCQPAKVKATVHNVYKELCRCGSLQPCTHVNNLFSQLVKLVLECPCNHEPEVLSDPSIVKLQPRLWAVCAEGEQQLELSWAERIASSRVPALELGLFPYLANYKRLTRLELRAIESVGIVPPRRVAFVGAGPLPLSALLLATELGVQVDCFDRDDRSAALAERVTKALGGALNIHHADVRETALDEYELVVLAALVGRTRSHKHAITRQMAHAMAEGATLLARSAQGMRTLLYPSIDCRGLDGFEVLTTVHPRDDVINSAVIARACR